MLFVKFMLNNWIEWGKSKEWNDIMFKRIGIRDVI